MRILHVYKSYYPDTVGGIEKYIALLTSNLTTSGIYTELVTTTTTKKQYTNLVQELKVHYFPATITMASCPMSVSLLRNFKSISNNFDLIHYHTPWPFADLVHMMHKIAKPYIITYHSDVVKQKLLKYCYAPLMHKFLGSSQVIIATSANYMASSPVLQCYQHKTISIPLGISSDDYPVLEPSVSKDLRNKIGHDFLLFIGVLRYYKGLNILLEAIQGTKIPLVIAGDGPERYKLEQIKKSKQLTNVTLLGKVTEQEKIALLTLCKVVVAPAHLRSEAFCLSLLEGLLFGKPLISTELGTGTSFVNKHNYSGLVIPPGDVQSLQQAIRTIWQDKQLYTRLQAGALQHYHEHFTSQKMLLRHTQVYQQALGLRNTSLLAS